MKKRGKYLLFAIMMFLHFVPVSLAITIRETLDSGDEYDTLESNSFIIGVTKFSGNEVITASKAATAGANDAMLYVQKNGTTAGYKAPVIYYYVDSFVGWFAIDTDNNATPVTDNDTLKKLSNLDIYYVNNNEKLIEVSHDGGNIIPSSLTNGATFKDNKILVPATISKFEFKTEDGNKIGYIMDNTISKFILDETICYTVESGIITNYDSTCSSSVIIPTHINDEEIIGIGENAFNNKNIKSIIIPSNIKYIKSNAFANNNLESVIIKEKYDESDFSTYGENIFGTFTKITYENDLTRALNLIDEDFVINTYTEIDINKLSYGQDTFMDFIGQLIRKKLLENNYEYTHSMVNCNYDTADKDKYCLILSANSDMQYELKLEKFSIEKDKLHQVSKTLDISFNKTGTKEDNNIVNEAIKNIKTYEETDEILEYHKQSGRIITRNIYLEDIEDNYNIEIVKTNPTIGSAIENEEIASHFTGRELFVFKNNVLYQISSIIVVGERNEYRTTLSIEDYQNLDAYIKDVFELFEVRTGVNNYEIIYNEDGSLYRTEQYGTGKNNYINVTDKDYNESWIINFFEYFEDSYDEKGNTKEECFIFSDGVITGYDGTCGPNVVIPSTINGENVTEIADYDYGYGRIKSFSSLKLKSVVLPNTLEKIGEDAFSFNNLTSIIIPNSVTETGNGAFAYNQIEKVTLSNNLDVISSSLFYSNKIKEINIPDSVTEISYDAFSDNEIESLEIPSSVLSIKSDAFKNNKISNLILPDTLQEIGDAAFNNNRLSEKEAIIYGRTYDYETDTYKIDKETIVSYAGANRNNIEIPSTVKKIANNAFANLDINNIEIPYGVEEIGYNAFDGNNLTSISVPDTVIYIGPSVFSYNAFEGDNCFIYSRDKDGNIDYTNLVAYSNGAHYNLDTIEIPSSVKKIWNYAFSNGTVNNLIIPYGIEEIGDYALQSINTKNAVTLPTSLKKIGKHVLGANYYSSADDNYVYAHDEEGNIDKTILMAYRSNYDEESKLVLPEGIVEIRENSFYNQLHSVKEIVLPSTLKVIGDSAFANNYSLEKITLNEGLEHIGDSAFNSGSINTIIIPSTVKTVGNYAIRYGLDSIEIIGKSSLEDFDSLGTNALGIQDGYTKVTFTN